MRIPRTFIRWVGVAGLAIATALTVVACGGGDGDGGGSAAGGGSSTGGGNTGGSGGTGGSGSGGGTANTANTAVITVNSGVASVINIPTVSVTVCAPGTTNCQVVNNVLVDTASYGLRLVGTAVSGLLGSLPQTTSGGAPLAECGKFVSSYTWGSVRTVDLSIGSEQASSLPVQIIGDLGTSNVPTSCTNGNTSANSAGTLGANGILGIGPAPYDCGDNCVTSTSSNYNNYYACPNGNASCTVTLVPLSQQVANPVHRFATDNNGVIVQMPNISNSGQASATGLLTFGIGTQSNNALGASSTLTSTTAGDVTATFLGRTVTAFFDTGSNAYFFDDASQAVCSRNTSFYCPTSTTTYSATLTGQNGTSAGVTMPVVNADAVFANTSTFAFNDIAGPFGSSQWLDLGLPHFYGKTIYFGMDRRSMGGAAPYVAF
ncbi:DUF3443 domain-containing protein [Burkholderia multivorans]|uniref:DUF3443 domain-containing protein n=1 Tax=Burkholderia multivorans TaxID=87883 RepID=UPI000CFF5745|nr:DUF3443 domain-containing protein [Burkholderia multivorans]MBH9664202.1 DUF3443 domain-containing protein [Burkholderia multivorans]MBU9414761.1 DUF3443 domain-containing protein [Burkholderia multivorans]PRG90842.1 hypothetical protein C6V04_18575 [Burkholderia multivorans]UQN69219.1 DUF3443 domain-containing protein [Burkholderia multivorans]UQN74947.1 DUF3443 domain-containing protein [Burkholderia multivorans]